MDSILIEIKNQTPVVGEYEDFDNEIIFHINLAFSVLRQLGVGPEKGFRIEDDSALWSDFVDENDPDLAMIKEYIRLKVKLAFDPPASTNAVEVIKELIKEYESRLTDQYSLKVKKEEVTDNEE